MTNDEAKEILISRKNSYLSNTDMAKAIDVAIQALTDSTPTDTARAEDETNVTVLLKAMGFPEFIGSPPIVSFDDALEAMTTYAAPIRAELERVRWEKELVMRQLSAANQRIAEMKKVYYLINNGDLNQEGLTLYYAVGDIIKKH